MPLVRVEVRNEYGLGPPELYKSAADSEDSKAVLDGVAVAGLVGILRQLGDLAQFASEVFHGLQDQVIITSSRSHKLILRLQGIEAVLPPIEKAILAQRSHLHFAYTSGTNWHSHIQNSQNYFIYGDLPRFIMDSYEECREPPRLHLLDKFDALGQGSCLKRYSDPTFFKRASAVSDEVNLQRVSKDNRFRKIKKKGREKNGEKSNGASLSRYTDSMQFGSLQTDGQNSSQAVSTFNVTLKSGLGDGSNSPDSRTGSGFIECIFHPSYSMQSEVYKPKASPSTQSNMPEDDTFYSTSVEGKTGGVDDGRRHSSPRDQNCLISSLAWDEKTEIVEPTGQQCDHDESMQVFSTNFYLRNQERSVHHDGETQDIPFTIFDQDIQETGTTTSIMVDQMGFQYNNTDMVTSISGVHLHDSIESETDNYMDARNFIESESETDIDFETKHEVEHFPNLNKPGEDTIPTLGTEDADVHPSYIEPPIAADSLSNKGILGNNSNLVSEETEPVSLSNVETFEDNKKEVSSDCYSHSQLLQMTDEAPKPSSSENIDLCEDNKKEVSFDCYSYSHLLQMTDESSKPSSSENVDLCRTACVLDSSNVESAVSNVSCCGSVAPNSYSPISDMTIHHHESPKPAPEPACSSSNNFWTNGGLLGLEPSKPPDFSSTNAVCQNSVASNKDDTVASSIKSNISQSEGNAGKSHIMTTSSKTIEESQHSKCTMSPTNDKKPILANIDTKVEEFSGSSERISANNSEGHSYNEMCKVRAGTESKGSSNVQATQVGLKDGKASSRMFDLSNRFLVNGLQRKLSIAQDGNSDPSTSLSTILSEEKSGQQTVTHQNLSRGAKELFQHASPVISPPHSPPLQHMRISFQPTDNFKTFKLKLKFPNGSNSHESCEDVFPSFQLVPESVVPLHDTGSDSDESTFSRSPYMSDDCLSRYTESNYEHWDSVDSPGSKDPDLLSFMEMRGVAYSDNGDNSGCQNSFFENGGQFSYSGGLPDLPMFERLNLSLEPKSTKACVFDKLFESNSCMEPNPSSPPLPPMQWRSTTLNLKVDEEKQDDTIEAIHYTSEPMLSGPPISQQPKPAPLRPECNIEVPDKKTMLLDKQMQNDHKESQAANGNIMDEKEDFLHQIRAKSFNLRPTVVAKPSVKQSPPSNANVSAILEKANAIRQVVGSDDGENDDSWSDT